jgi:hypothetical protein
MNARSKLMGESSVRLAALKDPEPAFPGWMSDEFGI